MRRHASIGRRPIFRALPTGKNSKEMGGREEKMCSELWFYFHTLSAEHSVDKQNPNRAINL
jgi:hypothetical protein